MCAAVLGAGLGVALKVECGSGEPVTPLLTRILHRMDVLSEEDCAVVSERFWPKVCSRTGQPVGCLKVIPL